MRGVTGQVDLAVLADEPPAAIDQDRGVVAPERIALAGELGVAQAEGEAEPCRLVPERARLGPGHLALEERVDLRLILHPPAGEERGEGQLREDHEVAAPGVGLPEEADQPLHDVGSAVAASDRAELGCADRDHAGHGAEPSTGDRRGKTAADRLRAGRLPSPGDYLLETAASLAWICGFGTAPMT